MTRDRSKGSEPDLSLVLAVRGLVRNKMLLGAGMADAGRPADTIALPQLADLPFIFSAILVIYGRAPTRAADAALTGAQFS